MLELLAPAGSPEAVIAAAANGADAVYLGFGDFNARQNAKNFTDEEFFKAAEYCRVRGIKLYLTINTLAFDRELSDISKLAKKASRAGADAILVQDLGVLNVIKQSVPDMEIHASTQMSIHSLEGAYAAAALGIKRIVLARELNREQIEFIAKNSPIETEIFVHGALCMCHSGQCYMSSVIGRRSGNRGLCAQPCRMSYNMAKRGSGYPLSLKDNCLVNYLSDIESMGVKCVKIEGRMKRPEYTGIVTGIYSKAIHEKRQPTQTELETLKEAFSRQGFTDGYFTGEHGKKMFGTRGEPPKKEPVIFGEARKYYMNNEYQRVPVDFFAKIQAGQTAKMVAKDADGNMAAAEGPVPEAAISRELNKISLQTQLYRTGGTPYYCSSLQSRIDEGLYLKASDINELRRSLLDQLTEKRSRTIPKQEKDYIPDAKVFNRGEAPGMIISVHSPEQLTEELLEFNPEYIYAPLEKFKDGIKKLEPFIRSERTKVALVMPRVILDTERPEIIRMLGDVRQFGIDSLVSGNIGHVLMGLQEGFKVRGDFGLNVTNSETLKVLKDMGLETATVSFEMMLSQIRDISKCIDTEMITYGRLPLMVTENCIIKNANDRCACEQTNLLEDRKGAAFPVLKEFGCRNGIYNSNKLYLGDKQRDFKRIGLRWYRLAFTTENPRECYQVAERYMEDESFFEPSGYTRGLYYRGVE